MVMDDIAERYMEKFEDAVLQKGNNKDEQVRDLILSNAFFTLTNIVLPIRNSAEGIRDLSKKTGLDPMKTLSDDLTNEEKTIILDEFRICKVLFDTIHQAIKKEFGR